MITDDTLREMLATDWDAITEEASRWHRAYSRGVRGQVVRAEDGYEYWIALAAMRRAYERGRAEGTVGSHDGDTTDFVSRQTAKDDRQRAWQPIATAPKDGTPFLAYWLRRFTDGTRYEAMQPYVVAHFDDRERMLPEWIDDDPPTHWMPLPAPPVEDGQ
jgi:hypothetical protein